MRLKYLGTAAIGLTLALIVLAALRMLFAGPDSALADEACIIAFVTFGIGVLALLLSLIAGKPRIRERSVSLARVDRVPEFDYTIVIPVFNRAGLLVDLHAAIEERLTAWTRCGRGEIVVVDDGSTDATPAVAARLAERSTLPMRVITQANKGVSGARNRGFWEARGAIGVVIDSDCVPTPEWLPAMLEAVRAQPGSIAFASVYSDRAARYPLEATPSGAKFVGASFAVRVTDFIRMGGNCERFSGASRDDSDLLLTARAAGLHPTTVEAARVWHPIRAQDASDIFRTGLHHRFDNLLVERHGDRALAFVGDALLGGSFAGHYPTSLFLYAYALLAAYDILAAALAHRASHLGGLIALALLLLVGWTLAQIVAARMMRVPRLRFGSFMMGNAAHVLGVAVGRLRGSLAYGIVLL